MCFRLLLLVDVPSPGGIVGQCGLVRPSGTALSVRGWYGKLVL